MPSYSSSVLMLGPEKPGDGMALGGDCRSFAVEAEIYNQPCSLQHSAENSHGKKPREKSLLHVRNPVPETA